MYNITFIGDSEYSMGIRKCPLKHGILGNVVFASTQEICFRKSSITSDLYSANVDNITLNFFTLLSRD